MKNITFHGIVAYEWRHARDLDLEPRQIRRAVSEFNDKFGTDRDHRYYIISGQNGYKLTKNKKEIALAIGGAESRIMKELERIGQHRRNFDKLHKQDLHDGGLL